MPPGPLLAGVVEQPLTDVLPDRLGSGQPDGVGLLDFDGPPAAAAGNPQQVLLYFGQPLRPDRGTGRTAVRCDVIQDGLPIFRRHLVPGCRQYRHCHRRSQQPAWYSSDQHNNPASFAYGEQRQQCSQLSVPPSFSVNVGVPPVVTTTTFSLKFAVRVTTPPTPTVPLPEVMPVPEVATEVTVEAAVSICKVPVTAGTGITSGAGDLNAGKVVTLTVNFSENVVVTTTAGTPTLTLSDGGTATYTGGTGSGALTFSYTVAAGQNTADLTVTAQ